MRSDSVQSVIKEDHLDDGSDITDYELDADFDDK